jgi:hypothetical protein
MSIYSIPLNNADIQFIGMYRSGNHAVIDWILSQIPCWTHYNNARLLGNYTAETDQIVTSKATALQNIRLVNFEDYDLLYLTDHLGDGTKVLLLRDPFNLFASRLQNTRNFVEDTNATFTSLDMMSCRAIQIWKDYARAFLSGDYTAINFNKWYSDKDYRREISDNLGLEFSDKGFGSKKGWRFSGGSSFEQMDVLNNWKHMAEDEEYLAFFDMEMIELSQEIFGPIPKLALQPDSLYLEAIEKIIEATLNYCLEEKFDEAKELLCQSQKVFPGNTRVAQLTQYLNRGLFTSGEHNERNMG